MPTQIKWPSNANFVINRNIKVKFRKYIKCDKNKFV